MTLYEKVIEDVHTDVDESVLRKDLMAALQSESIKEDEVKHLFKMFYTKQLIDLPLLKECVNLFVCEKQTLIFNEVLCERACQLHYDNPEEIKDYTFNLVVSINGYERALGRKIWDKLGMGNSDIDILSFSEELQCRFALSIVQDMLSPKERLPKLLNLFNSPVVFVRQTLINVLPMYTLNYFGLVKRMFESQEFKDSDELSKFKELLEVCDNRFTLCKECVEFHSEYSMPSVQEICMRESSDYMRKQTENIESLKRPSFLDYVTKVNLGRGGGWRNEDGTVHTLQRIQYSMEMPMLISSLTPLEVREYTQKLYEDWSKIEMKDEK